MYNTLKQLTLLSALTICVFPSARPAVAQEFRGIISGRTLDPTEAGVPGAQITVTNVETNASTTTTSNDEGNYRVPYLKPGIYTVIAEASGYKKLFRPQIEVRVGRRRPRGPARNQVNLLS